VKGARRVVSIAGWLAIAAAAGQAFASPPRTSSLELVRGDGAESCSGAADLERAVETRLGRSVFVPRERADVAIEVRIDRRANPEKFRAIVTLRGDNAAVLGTRTIESASSCSALDAPLALVVALLIDPDAALAPPPAPEAPPPHAPDPPSAPAPPPPATPPAVARPTSRPSPPPIPPPSSAPARPWRSFLYAHLALSAGLLPHVGTGLGASVWIQPPLGPSWLLGATAWLQNDAGDGVSGGHFQRTAGHLAVCPLTLGGTPTRLLACGGINVGALRVSGFGYDRTYPQERPVVDAMLEMQVIRRLVGPLAATAGLGLAVPFVRDRYNFVESSGTRRTVFDPLPVAGILQIGVGAELP
jgi:hypothetical protein